jgi:3-phytase
MRAPFLVLALLMAGCAGTAGPTSDPSRSVSQARNDQAFTLAASYVVPRTGDQFPSGFNGISSLVPIRDGHEMLALPDDRESSRVYRIGVDWTAAGLAVKVVETIPLQRTSGAPAGLDPEGITITRDGHMIVSSEGIANVEPRIPPALVEYGADGRFIRQLPLRPRYLPTPKGQVTTGVRENAGFEALAIAPDFSKLFTATELPLAQDGPSNAFAAGTHARILEYVAQGDSYIPAREFAYELSAVEPAPFTTRFSINGVVELLVLEEGDLLLMERAFAESIDRSQSMNRIRIFRISLEGATDVSTLDSLVGAKFTPVKKTLVLDVNRVPGLIPRLENLDNFEGMAWGPAETPSGPRSLVLVSDNNENPRQVTAFMLFKRRM